MSKKEEVSSSEEGSESDSDDSWLTEETPELKLLEEALSDHPRASSYGSGSVSAASTSFSESDRELNAIETALLLNKQADEKYCRLQKVLSIRLRECRQKLKENEAKIMCLSSKQEDFRYILCGKPYFKDKDNYPPPDNVDTVMIRNNQMYDFSGVSAVPGWTIKDKSQLVNGLHEVSRERLKLQLTNKIDKLRKEPTPENNPVINMIMQEISGLRKKSLADIALPINEEYDWEALANRLNRRHSAQEYRALWRLFLHPSINKKNWSKTEHQQLQAIAEEFKMQDWDAIALKLNTGRTGYQCFVYYRANMNNTATRQKWTEKEVSDLDKIIEYCREGQFIPWSKVASLMQNRTKIQVYNKYTRMVEYRKGRFLPEEDTVILKCYEKYGLNFRKISEFLPGRSVVQLRTRYQLLTKMRLSATWTVQDDKKLLQIMANADCNANFSSATQHFPGKDRVHIRTRYITLMKWMKNHPATDLSMAPRRGPRRLYNGFSDASLSEAVKNLQDRIKIDFTNTKPKKLTRQAPRADIINALTLLVYKKVTEREAELERQEEQNKLAEQLLGIPSDSDNKAPLPSSPHTVKDVVHLQKLLVLLNSSLDKSKVQDSPYSDTVETLDKPLQPSNRLTFRSYSRKERVKTIQIKNVPDVWGHTQLGRLSNALPPNYNTITGCAILMKHLSYLSNIFDDDINLSLMVRKNEVFRNTLVKLRDRFITAFLWPLALSNEGPPPLDLNAEYVSISPTKHRYLPEPPCITIPVLKKCYLKYATSNQTAIDCIATNGKETVEVDPINSSYEDMDDEYTDISDEIVVRKVPYKSKGKAKNASKEIFRKPKIRDNVKNETGEAASLCKDLQT